MPGTLTACPTCDRRVSGGLFGGNWFPLYGCSDCGHRYCYKCPATAGGTKCPRCGSTRRSTVAHVVQRR